VLKIRINQIIAVNPLQLAYFVILAVFLRVF